MDIFSRYLPSWSSNRNQTGADAQSDTPNSPPDPSSTTPRSLKQTSPSQTTGNTAPAPPTIAVPTISSDDSSKSKENPGESPEQQTANKASLKPATANRNNETPQPKAGESKTSQPKGTQPSPPGPSVNPSSLMPPPAAPVPRLRQTPQPDRSPSGLAPPRVGNAPRTPISSAGAARLNPSAGSSLSASNLAPQSLAGGKKSEFSRRVILGPGYSPLDWAALAADPKNKLRGENVPSEFIRVTPSMLKAQNGRKGRDAWTSYQGKVYNISPYLPYHPGGKGELLRGAGKDSGKLFQEVHPWVNWDGILNECLVGILVSEDAPAENALDSMD